MSNELLRRLKAHLKLKRMLDMQVTHEKSPMGKPSYRVPGDQSLAVPANSRKPINELDAVLGTRDDNPRLPLHLLNTEFGGTRPFDPYADPYAGQMT